MPSSKNPASEPLWYVIPARILLITFLLTLLSFAVSLLLGILGIVIAARLHGIHPNLTIAYRQIAIPAAAVVGAIALISITVVEIRHHRQAKALAQIERISQV
jgi:prepilin signal peptidase PulO-like enzyme (type II secretory pathway)